MTPTDKFLKCKAVADMMKSFEGHNRYSQTVRNNVVSVGQGSGDCSSTVAAAYKKVLGINIGVNTVDQISNKALATLENLKIIDGVPDETYILPGDLLYFRGTDPSRKDSFYVGHVEMYVGDGELSSHGGPGWGPTRKKMVDYCKKRQHTVSAKVSPANKGLICVRRAKDLVGAMPPDVVPPPIGQDPDCFPAYKGHSQKITIALQEVGCTDTSLRYRKVIAEINNIENYEGTFSQNGTMLNMLKLGILINPQSKVKCYPAYIGQSKSIVQALREVHCRDTGMKYRKKIAAVNCIENYKGTAIQNILMLDLLRAGRLIDPEL